MSNIKNFVSSNNIPEFVKEDHELFGTFIEAYYEWLEKKNDSDSANYSEVYKAVGNPAYVADNNQIINDIDETIDEFTKYFTETLVPISLEGIQTDPRFFMKKVREMYLAKGTIKSFQLFFKLYYNDNIEVFETEDTVLKASDGKYFSFPTAHFYIEEFEDQLQSLDLTLAELRNDSDQLVGTVLSGNVIDRTLQQQSVLKIQFSYDVDLTPGESYFIKDANDPVQIKVKPLVSISEFTLTSSGSLYNENDTIFIDSQSLGKSFYSSVTSTSSGYVEGIKVRDKGQYYSVDDRFDFSNENKTDGFFAPTSIDLTGAIQAINNVPLRTGPSNTGWLANNLEDVYIPLVQSGLWKTLPNISYRSSSSQFTGVGSPYLKDQNQGIGFQSIPVSKSIGKALSVELGQVTYFTDSDDVQFNPPATVIVENNDLKVGQEVVFQVFDDYADYGPFKDDSEQLTLTFNVQRFYDVNEATGNDSEVTNFIDHISVPYAFDSDNFSWKVKNVPIDRNVKDPNLFQVIKDLFDSESNFSYRVVEDGPIDIAYDGGPSFGYVSDSEIIGSLTDLNYGDSEKNDSDVIDGGPFDFAGIFTYSISVILEGEYISKLERFHFEQLDKISGLDSDRNSFEWETSRGSPTLIGTNESLDAGIWRDTGYRGKVTSIDSNNKVAKVISTGGSLLPTQEQLDELSKDKYHVVILSPLDINGVVEQHYSLPLKNVVHQIDRMTFDYKTDIVSNIFKRFWTQNGFASSSFGGTLRDNYYYSDHSYRIKTNIPFSDWKEKFKSMLHPAGTVLSAEYIQNMEVAGAVSEGNLTRSFASRTNLTFDMQQEHIDTALEGINDGADSIYYKSNAFESLNLDGTNAISLDASKQSSIPGLSAKQQSGNSFWDFEPVGWVHTANSVSSDNRFVKDSSGNFITNFQGEIVPVNIKGTAEFDINGQFLNYDSDFWFEYQGQIYQKWRWFVYTDSDGLSVVKERENHDSEFLFSNRYTTQSMDSENKIVNGYTYHTFFNGSRQDFYKTNSRTQQKPVFVSKVQFEDASLNFYDAYDSELPQDFMTTFSDSDKVFKGIDYDRLKSDSDERRFPSFVIPRTSEIASSKERDLLTAMKENNELVWNDSDITYYDYDAYERKWNYINNKRTKNTEGWTIKGFLNHYAYDAAKRNVDRRKEYIAKDFRQYSKINTPLNRDIWNKGTVVWNKHYFDNTNTHYVDNSYEKESYRDPQVSMRGRKKRGR